MKDILQLAREIDDLQIDSSQKLWVQYTTGLDLGVDEAEQRVRKAYRDKGSFLLIQRTLDRDLTPTDRRRVEILYRDFRPYHQSNRANAIKDKIATLETKLGDLLSRHRVVLDGRELPGTEIGRILTESADRDLRKQAFLSRAQVNQKLVDAGFLDLINFRREYALTCGASDFIAFQLEKDDLAPDLFKGWHEQCAGQRQTYRNILNSLALRYLETDRLAPWDEHYMRNLVCPHNRKSIDLTDFRTVLAKAFRAFGFEIEGLPITYDVFSRENKSEWGYMFPLRIGKDVRVLANMDNRFSSYSVLMHETAHAVHYLHLDPEERLLNWGVSRAVSEGFANFFGDLCNSREFLSQFFETTEGRDELGEALASFSRFKCLADLGQVSFVALTLFDQELYRRDLNSLNDINELKWSIDRELLGSEPYGEEPPWGHLIHHTTAPIYLHNYFLGDILCESMKGAFGRRTGCLWHERPREFGHMWRDEVLAPSGLYPFADLYERVTGEGPNIGGYLKSVVKQAERVITSESPNELTT